MEAGRSGGVRGVGGGLRLMSGSGPPENWASRSGDMRRGFVDVDEDERVAAGREGVAIVVAGLGRGRGRGREIKRETESGREGEGAIVAGPGMEEDLDFLSSIPGASGRRSWAGGGGVGVAETLGTYKAISQREGGAEDGGAGEGWGMGGPRRVPGGRDQMGVNVNEGGGRYIAWVWSPVCRMS
jgi:hypothetical protein